MKHNYHFKEIGAGEQIIKVMHRNWFSLFLQFVPILFMAGALFASFTFIPRIFPEFSDPDFRPLFLFVESLFVLALWIFTFFLWIDYYFDVWIITSERVINIEQLGLFSRRVSELKYTKIQDITTDVHGFIPTILNFGDVYVQTAAEKERFVFRQISNPYGVKSLISKIQKEHDDSLRETEVPEMRPEAIKRPF